MPKMPRAPKSKPGELKLQWGKLPGESEPEVCGSCGEGCSKSDLYLMFSALCNEDSINPSIADQLQLRGYDITTIKFSIQKIKKDD